MPEVLRARDTGSNDPGEIKDMAIGLWFVTSNCWGNSETTGFGRPQKEGLPQRDWKKGEHTSIGCPRQVSDLERQVLERD
eukprot:5539579-Heterocapsa_arctica.AAC.1